MRIRTANGVGLVRLVVALVIIVAVMSGSAFGQQQQRGRVKKSVITSSKKSDAVQQPIRREPEVKTQGEGSDGQGKEAPQPRTDIEDYIVNPYLPNGSGHLPGVNPFPSGANPPGGGSSGEPPVEPLCTMECVCPLLNPNGQSVGVEYSNETTPPCTDIVYFTYSGTATKKYNARCSADKNAVCKGTGGVYVGCTLSGTKYKYLGCNAEAIVVEQKSYFVDKTENIPTQYNQLGVPPGCQGGF